MERSRDRARVVVVLAAVLALLAAGCSDDGEPSDDAAPDTTTTSTTLAPSSSTSPSTTAPEPDCEPGPVLTEVDEALDQVRLGAGGGWEVGGDATTRFDERTVTAEEQRESLGLDCALRAAQTTDDGGERLVLASWTGDRVTFVVQASDPPSEPFQQTSRFDLLISRPLGEMFVGPYRPNRDIQTIWAGTIEDGSSVVVSSRDYPEGAVAKTWQAGFEVPGDDEFVTLDAERYGMERLREAGARNVSIAELPEVDSEIGSIQLVTPTGQVVITRVAPLGWIDPTYEWHQRPIDTEDVDGVTLHISEAGPPDDDDILTFDVAHIAFECGDWVWHVTTGYGTTDELREFVASDLLGVLDC